MLETYGSTTPFGSALIREKSKQTNLFRYGYKVANQNPQIHQKGIKTCLKRYGVENPAHIPSVKRASEQSRRANYDDLFVLKLAQKNIELITDKQTYCDDIDAKLTYKCKVCGTQWESDVTNYQRVFCEDCYKQPFSQGEIKIREFIKSICKHEIIYNDRTTLEGKELDIWIPDLNIAIEFNGNYWHSELFKSENYHQQKTIKCREKGIRLIHIFEHEFTNKPQSVYNLLQSALGIGEVIYGPSLYCRTD